jgi:hypothetical protein
MKIRNFILIIFTIIFIASIANPIQTILRIQKVEYQRRSLVEENNRVKKEQLQRSRIRKKGT